MKIINKETNEVIGTITTNHSMTLDEACALLEIKIMQTEEDYQQENGYDYESLEIIV